MKISRTNRGKSNRLQSLDSSLVLPNWVVPENIMACSTTRLGGVSHPPYDSFNLATHVGDARLDVNQNRQRLSQRIGLSYEPSWLDQQHTTRTVELTQQNQYSNFIADASWTQQSGIVCAVLTADCLPILITNKAGNLVAAIHAGWRGLLNGIVSQTIQALPDLAENLIVWVGPAISQTYFEIGEEVVEAFCDKDAENAIFFTASLSNPTKKCLNLPGLVEKELKNIGVEQISLSGLCTFKEDALFFSYRRESQTGRIASLIWLEAVPKNDKNDGI